MEVINTWYNRYRHWKFKKKPRSADTYIKELDHLVNKSDDIELYNYDELSSEFLSLGTLLGAFGALNSYVKYGKDPVYSTGFPSDFYYYDWMMDQDGYEVSYRLACVKLRRHIVNLKSHAQPVDLDLIEQRHKVVWRTLDVLIDLGYKSLYVK
jgi:hypothetical protein